MKVVVYDTLSGTNDYAVEMVQALVSSASAQPLTVVTVDNTRLRPSPGLRLLPVVPAYAKPLPRWRKALQMARAYAVLLALCLRAPRQTVLHVVFLRFERLEARLFGWLQRCGVRVVASAHNALPHDEAPWHREFYRRWYAQVDLLHVLSQPVLDDVLGTVGAKPRRTALVGHGPYSGLKQRFGGLDVVARRRELGIAPGRFVLLQYGLFKEYKGLDRLAAALLHLPAEQRPLLVLAGGGPAEHLAAVQQRIVGGGRGDCLLWLQRFVSDDELCGLVQVADLVLFPYLKVSQSGALWLAMTFGKPCLCHDLPGFRAMLPADEAFFVDAADPALLAQRIGALMQQAEELARQRDEIERWTAGAAGWQHIAEQSWAMYREARVSPRSSR